MKIKIEKQHIEKGEPATSMDCPIAIAFWELFPEAKLVSVECDAIYFGIGNTDYKVDLPDSAKQFIRNFDVQETRELAIPFEFDLPELEEVVEDDNY